MRNVIGAIILAVAFSLAHSGTASGQADVIVGDLYSPLSWGPVLVGNPPVSYNAYAMGTVSCNIGTVPLNWIAGTNQHPVIGQSLYRLQNGRFEQIGISWLKHGFTALAQNLCATCNNPGTGTLLGVGCSDPYSASLNGSQSGLGSRSEVNAATGVFTYPQVLAPAVLDSTSARLRVLTADVDPTQNAGAQYFVEGQYITQDDAASGNDDNNASYRRVTFNSTTFAMSTSGQTVRLKPGLLAWKDVDPLVEIRYLDVPGDGRFILASRATLLPTGSYHFEFALENLNSDRSGQSFVLGFPAGSTISGQGFHDIEYHSGDPYSGTDWTATTTAGPSGGNATWATQSFATNPNANALRWGTCYSFWCDASAYPSTATIVLFKPGSAGSSTTVQTIPFPPLSMSLPNGNPAFLPINQPQTVDFDVINLSGTVDQGSGQIFVSTNGGAFVSQPAVWIGGNTFRATLPGGPYNTRYDWYAQASAIGIATPTRLPADAPASFFTSESGLGLFADDFETAQAWTVTNSASLTTGQWERGVPVGGGDRGDPAVDADGSGSCYVTQNVDGDFDVDGGSTTLTSPVIDLTSMVSAHVRFRYWHDNSTAIGVPNQTNTDTLVVQLTANGTTWVPGFIQGASTGGWVYADLDIGAFVPLTATFQIRFISTDGAASSTVESGLDSVTVLAWADPIGLTGPVAEGNVGIAFGGPYETFYVNNSTGGILNKVVVGLSQPITFLMAQPVVTPFPASFVVFGFLGLPTPADAVPLGAVGSFSFIPAPMLPGHPLLFTLADSFNITGGTAYTGATQTPWSFTYGPGLPFPIVVTLQGIIVDTSSAVSASVTNAIVVEVK